MQYGGQLEIFNPDLFHTPVHIIGVGASGSWVALMLAKLGVSQIHVWDFDQLEDHNLCNQAFKRTQVGQDKVDAVREVCAEMSEIEVIIHHDAVDGNTPLTGIVFVLTDTMSSRAEIWRGALKYKANVKLVIETRMGLDMCRIYNVNPTDLDQIKGYESTFSYDDSQAEVSACGTSKSVITSAVTVASIAVRQMLNFINEKDMPNEIIYDFAFNNYLTTKWNTQ